MLGVMCLTSKTYVLKEFQMCYSEIVEVSKGLLTPMIAIVTIYIAWQQMKINNQKLTLDKYDRRLKVYSDVKQFISIIQKTRKVKDEDLVKLQEAMSVADFLFNRDIPEYLKEIHNHAALFLEWSDKKSDYSESESSKSELNKIIKGLGEERTWLTRQQEVSKDLFRKYLCIT